MRRRALLASATALIAGCAGAGDGSGAGPTTVRSTPPTTPPVSDSTTATEPTTTTETTAVSTAYDLLPPEPQSETESAVRERLAGRRCPRFDDRRTICPGGDGPLAVSVSPAVADLADGTVECSLENVGESPFSLNEYRWLLRKWDGSRWRRIAPLAVPAPLHRIDPGGSHTYRITADNSTFRGLDAYTHRQDVALAGIGPGVYAFSVDGYFESAPDDELAATAVFGFAGEGQPVRPTDDVVRVERDGSELIVHGPMAGENAGSEGNGVAISLVEGEADARLLPEHVLQVRGLRNTVPYAATDGVRTIRYLGNAGNVAGYLRATTPAGATRFGFRGVVFGVAEG